jgi:hypothetical protein
MLKDLYPEHSIAFAGIRRVCQSSGDRLADECISLDIEDQFFEGDLELM